MYCGGAIKKYLDDLSAGRATPGGGSAAGMSGALGAALLEMVCNFTIGKERYRAFEQDIRAHLFSLKKIREEFTGIIDRDVEVYGEIRYAFKSKDKKLIDKALKDGYHVSLTVCRLSRDGMRIAHDLPEKANPNLITDVGCGAELLNAAFNSGNYNADINLNGIEDKDFISREKGMLKTLKDEIKGLHKITEAKTGKRTG